MSKISRPGGQLFIAALAVSLGACASTGSGVRVQQGEMDLTACRTFDWLPASQEAASFGEQRVRAAAMSQLLAKGYAQAAGNPDCRITYVLSLQENNPAKPRVGVGVGGGSGGVGGGLGVSLPLSRKNRQSATFTLDVIDVASNAQIWSGTLDTDFRAGGITQEEADAVVREILSQFPNRIAAPEPA